MKTHIIPHAAQQSADDLTVISFEANERDAATLIHAYMGMSNIVGVVLTRGSRAVTIRQVDYNSDGFNNCIDELFGPGESV